MKNETAIAECLKDGNRLPHAMYDISGFLSSDNQLNHRLIMSVGKYGVRATLFFADDLNAVTLETRRAHIFHISIKVFGMGDPANHYSAAGLMADRFIRKMKTGEKY